jgi:DNA polymerase-1
MRAPLLVIDGDSFAHRAYHALPRTIRRRGNRGAGAILGFANYLLRFHESEKPRAVLVAWDTLDAPTYRHDALPGYQSGRAFDDELVDQLEALPEFVTACGFACAKAAGYEADDFLAAAVAREERRGGTAIVATGDRDAYQLASDRTTVLQPVRAGELARIGPAEVRARYGVDPKQVPDFIAFRGDSSDRIPGLAGMGPQGAASLLRRYGSLENAIKAGRFAPQAEMLRLYRSIATMDKTAPLPPLRHQKPTWARAARLAHHWQLKKLGERLEALALPSALADGESALRLSPRRSFAPARAAGAATQSPAGLVRRNVGGGHKRQACEVRHGAQRPDNPYALQSRIRDRERPAWTSGHRGLSSPGSMPRHWSGSWRRP